MSQVSRKPSSKRYWVTSVKAGDCVDVGEVRILVKVAAANKLKLIFEVPEAFVIVKAKADA